MLVGMPYRAAILSPRHREMVTRGGDRRAVGIRINTTHKHGSSTVIGLTLICVRRIE